MSYWHLDRRSCTTRYHLHSGYGMGFSVHPQPSFILEKSFWHLLNSSVKVQHSPFLLRRDYCRIAAHIHSSVSFSYKLKSFFLISLIVSYNFYRVDQEVCGLLVDLHSPHQRGRGKEGPSGPRWTEETDRPEEREETTGSRDGGVR